MVLLAQVFQMALLKSQLEGGGDDAGGDVVHGAAAVEHARVVEGGHQLGGDLDKVARWQNLIPSFPLCQGEGCWGAIQGKEGIKSCSAAQRSHSPSSPTGQTQHAV